MDLRIEHLFRHPGRLGLVAGWIHAEFWTGKDGYSVETFEHLLHDARDPDRIPLSLLALADGAPAGTVNLIENDDPARVELRPWLAALFVAPAFRGHGIGAALVRALAGEARRLGCREMYLGTDIPDFYRPLGAVVHEQVTDAFCIMRIPLEDGGRAGTR